MTVYVLDDDRRTVDDDAKVDCADAKQIGRFPLNIEYGNREQERQRNHDRDDACARQITEENEENRDHQSHADQQVVQDVMGRHVNQLGPFIEYPQLHSSRQNLLFFDLFYLFLDQIGGPERFFVLSHQDDAFDHVVFLLGAGMPPHDP